MRSHFERNCTDFSYRKNGCIYEEWNDEFPIETERHFEGHSEEGEQMNGTSMGADPWLVVWRDRFIFCFGVAVEERLFQDVPKHECELTVRAVLISRRRNGRVYSQARS